MKNKYIILVLTFLYMLIGQQSYGQDYNEDDGNLIANDTVFLPELPITNNYTNVDNTPDIYLQYSYLLNNTGNYCVMCFDDDEVSNEEQIPIPLPTPAPFIYTPECWYCDQNNNYIGAGVNPLPPMHGGSAYLEYRIPGHYGYLIDFIGSEFYGSGFADIAIKHSINYYLYIRIPIKEVRDLAYLMSAADEQYHYEFYKFVQLNPVIGLKILKAYTASVNKEDAFINNMALALIAGNANITVAMSIILIPRIIQYYNYELNRLRLENPNWSEFKLKSTAALNLFQTGLDIIGLIPAIGEVADLVNGGIYLVRGDLANATISGLALIPIGGQAFTGSRLAIKIVDGVAVPIAKGADEVAALAQGIGKYLDEIYTSQKSVINQWKNTIANATNIRKGNFGEMASDAFLSEKGWQPLHARLQNIDAPTRQGLDGVFKNGDDYFIVESKYHGTATLSTLADGTKQMSDAWITGGTRLLDAVNGNVSLRNQIANNYRRLLAEIAPDGTVVYKELDAQASVIGIFTP